MSKVLFIGPLFMGIYKDIIAEFNRRGDEVDFIAERSLNEDPYNVRGYAGQGKNVDAEKFLIENEKYWKHLLCETNEYSGRYDVLFVLDGQGLHPIVFNILKKRNPELYSVNYLFDTTKGVYRFDKYFSLFDKVATFDIEESEKYGIPLLPIYWVPVGLFSVKYKFFGLGRYSPERAVLFKKLEAIAANNNYFLKWQGEHIKFFALKYLVRAFLGKNEGRVTLRDYYSDMFITNPLSVEEFRQKIAESEIIVDTNAPHQDGLTARFMWALGLGKKILTTNEAVKLYDFYTSNQIFVVKDIDQIQNDEGFLAFSDSKFEFPPTLKKLIDSYRIDNWLDFLLSVQ